VFSYAMVVIMIALYSRLPLSRAKIVYIGAAGVPSVIAEVEVAGERATVISTHPLPPAGSSYSRWRNDQLEKIPEFVGNATSPVLLLGDLNVTPWSHHFRRLLKRTGLRDASQGRGVQPTWPTHNRLLRIPIDHCLHSPEIVVVQKEIGPHVGSDHFPVIVDFIVASSEKVGGPTCQFR
jgi:endonuclease/exonuclease/phosphatase (EEP) superfamily protein YafD